MIRLNIDTGTGTGTGTGTESCLDKGTHVEFHVFELFSLKTVYWY